MPIPRRSNPLALAVLVALYEEPLHPYEIAQRLKARKKHESVRLNYGSLYAVVESLAKRGYLAAHATTQEGRLPPRTVYEITDAGRQEMQDWLADLLATPIPDYPHFEAALSFLPALPPEEALRLLQTRIQALEFAQAEYEGARNHLERQAFPRLFALESEFRAALRQTELTFARQLASDIHTGRLEGLAWWRDAYQRGSMRTQLPEDRPSDLGVSDDRSPVE